MTSASDLPVGGHDGQSKPDASVLLPKVSVVVSAMNGDPWIDQCIQSVLAQTPPSRFLLLKNKNCVTEVLAVNFQFIPKSSNQS